MPSTLSGCLARLTGVRQDVGYSLRLLRRRPGYAAAAIATVALAIGATTILFSVISGVLLTPLPWARSNRLVRVIEYRRGLSARVPDTVSNGSYRAWRVHPKTIQDIGGWMTARQTLTAHGGAMRLQVSSVTPSLFRVLEVPPVLGRTFVKGEGAQGQPGVVILSYGLWQERFGGGRRAIGRTIRLDDQRYTVVGVMGPRFAFPDRETRAWIPWQVVPVLGGTAAHPFYRMQIFDALARLRPGATPQEAAAEATVRARAAPVNDLPAMALFGAKGPIDIAVRPALAVATTTVRPLLLLLLAGVGLLLATAIANIANLQLVHATTRESELAIRAAIGAGSGRLVQQTICESLTITVLGGMAGLGLAFAALPLLPHLIPHDFPRVDTITIDGRVVAFVALLSLLTGVSCGLLPALRARRASLLSNAPGRSTRGATSRATHLARSLLLVAQITASCVLLAGTLVLSRSVLALVHADRGYNPQNLLTAEIAFPPDYAPRRRQEILDGLTARLRATSGVQAAAFANALPFVSSGGYIAFTMPSPQDPGEQIDVQAMRRVVSPGYLTAMQLHLVAGRFLARSDTATSEPVVVVNRSFARRYLRGNPVGMPLQMQMAGPTRTWKIVGVVSDIVQGDLGRPAEPEIFLSDRQIPLSRQDPDLFVMARTAGAPDALVPTLRALLRAQDSTLALDSVLTMEQRVDQSVATLRSSAFVLGAFAASALLIALVGLFGVLSYVVVQRSREIGVRMALGATPQGIVRLVLRQAVVVLIAGIAVGSWVTWVAARSAGTMLQGIGTPAVSSMAVAAILLAAGAALAALVPAYRAASVDPAVVLRAE